MWPSTRRERAELNKLINEKVASHTVVTTAAAVAAATTLITAQNLTTVHLASAETVTGAKTFSGGVGVFGHAVPVAQPAVPVTLADVIAVLQAYGLSA